MLTTFVSYELKGIAITYKATSHKSKKRLRTETNLKKVKSKNIFGNFLFFFDFKQYQSYSTLQ